MGWGRSAGSRVHSHRDAERDSRSWARACSGVRAAGAAGAAVAVLVLLVLPLPLPLLPLPCWPSFLPFSAGSWSWRRPMPMPMRLPALLLQRRLLLLPVLVPVRLPALLMVLLPGLAGTVADSGGGGGGGGGSGRGGAWAGPGAQAVPARITRAYVGARRLTGAGPPRIWSGSAAGREVCYTLPAGEEVGQGRARGGGQGR